MQHKLFYFMLDADLVNHEMIIPLKPLKCTQIMHYFLVDLLFTHLHRLWADIISPVKWFGTVLLVSHHGDGFNLPQNNGGEWGFIYGALKYSAVTEVGPSKTADSGLSRVTKQFRKCSRYYLAYSFSILWAAHGIPFTSIVFGVSAEMTFANKTKTACMARYQTT